MKDPLSSGLPAALIERLRMQAHDIRRLTSGLDEAGFASRTVPDKWSPKELVCHLLSVQHVFAGRIETVLAQDDPPIAKYDPDRDPEFGTLAAVPGFGILTRFEEERESFCRWLDGLAAADWSRRGRHPDFHHYDVLFQIEYMVHHEAHHVYQLLQRRIPLGPIPRT
jgi:hypothetical protein